MLNTSAVVFSGYLPIEVTHEEFQKTVEDNNIGDGNKMSGRKKNFLSHRGMTKKIGELLSTSRTKKINSISGSGGINNIDNDSNLNKHYNSSSISGINNQCQQSVANITVDSASTIKASNLETQSRVVCESSTLQKTDSIEAIAFTDSSATMTSRKGNINSYSNIHSRQSKPWKNLKRLVVKGKYNNRCPSTSSYSPDILNNSQGISAQPSRLSSIFASSMLNTAYPMRKRTCSEGVLPQRHHRHPHHHSLKDRGNNDEKKYNCSNKNSFLSKRRGTMSFSGLASQQRVIDNVIRGRLDGVDVLSLGPASQDTLPIASSETKQKSSKTSGKKYVDSEEVSFDPLYRSFTNLVSFASTANIVDDMIWGSAGKEPPEIILEGFFPGGIDRWSVHIATPSEEQITAVPYDENSVSPLVLKLNTDDDRSTAFPSHKMIENDGGTYMPIAQLWYNLWGILATPPPIPTHMQTIVTVTTNSTTTMTTEGVDNPLHIEVEEEEDEIQQLTATCNVPIDLDDDAFIIDCPIHLQSVHEIIMVPLQSGRFNPAISIFEKLQRGLESNGKFEHLTATTIHNIGMIQLCQKRYEDALESFRKAVQIRKKCLPLKHPDIAVSLNRQGMAHFALSSIDEALKCFEAALKICTSEDNTRAKILNNIGVARYQLMDFVQSLKSLTSALEIQSSLLDGPVRRECMVYDASTTLSNMGKVYLKKGDSDLAYLVFEEACLMQTSIFRKDHDIVLFSLDNMARSHVKNEKFPEALRIFTSLYRSQEARFGPDNKICIETVGMMGTIHFKLLEYEEAFECMKKVASWQSKRMELMHPSVQITNKCINQIERCLQGEELMWV